MRPSLVDGKLVHDALGALEEVDGVLAVHDHVALESQGVEYLSLHLRAGLGELDQGVSAEAVDVLLELAGLDVSEFLGLADLQFLDLLDPLQVEARLVLLEGQLGSLQDLPSLGFKLGDDDLGFTLDFQLLGHGFGFGFGLASGFDGLALSLEVVELSPFLLSEGLVFDLALLEAGLGFLLVLVGELLGLGFLHAGGDLNGEGHELVQGLLGLLVDGLHFLDVHVGHDQVVVGEGDLVSDLALAVQAEDGLADVSGG